MNIVEYINGKQYVINKIVNTFGKQYVINEIMNTLSNP